MGARDLVRKGWQDLSSGILKEGSTGIDVRKDMKEQGIALLTWADPYYPDYAMPEVVKEAMIRSLDEPAATHYSLPMGMYELRVKLAEIESKKTGLQLNPSKHIIVTPGGTTALSYAMMLFLDKGDKVMIPEPSYPDNLEVAHLLGAEIISVPLLPEKDFQLDLKTLEDSYEEGAKAVLITHPNNATSAPYNRASLEAIAEFVKKHDMVLLSDEAFSDHVFDGEEMIHPATLPGMWERTLTMGSISKGYGLSGLRIGYIWGHEQLLDVLYAAIEPMFGPAGTAASYGALAAVSHPEILEENGRFYDKRRKMAYEIFNSVPGVSMRMPKSGISAWVDVHKLGTSAEVAEYLLKNAKAQVNPGHRYGPHGEGYIRVVYTCLKDDAEAAKVYGRIKDALATLAKEKGVS